MTDAELIKALECCYGGVREDCKNCPNRNTCSDIDIIEAVTNLINRQKAEIKKLENIERIADKTISVQQAEIEALINGQKTLQKHIAEQKAEIERLKAMVEAAEDYLNPLPFKNAYDEAIERAKAEAIKEFAERLKEEYAVYEGMGYVKIDLDTLLKNIDNLVKEMTEVDKNV